MSITSYMEAETRIVQYVKSWWVSGATVYDRAKSWWASAIDKQDPCIRISLLVFGDVLGWAFLLLGGFCLVALGILGFVLVFGVLLFPFYYLTVHLGTNYLFNKATTVYGLGVLAISNVILYGLWWLRMPESDVLKRKYGIDSEISPEALIERFQHASLLVLWLGGSAYCAVICLDVLLVLAGFAFTIYYAVYNSYSFLWFLVNNIPWYAILPTAFFTPLVFISMYRRMTREVWIKEIWEKPKFEHLPADNFHVDVGRLPV